MDLIQRLRSRPVHVRRRIALATSGTITTVIALGWLVASISLGAFSPSPQVAQDTNLTNSFADTQASVSNLIGGAGNSVTEGESQSASANGLTVVNATKPVPQVVVDPSSQTVIPF